MRKNALQSTARVLFYVVSFSTGFWACLILGVALLVWGVPWLTAVALACLWHGLGYFPKIGLALLARRR